MLVISGTCVGVEETPRVNTNDGTQFIARTVLLGKDNGEDGPGAFVALSGLALKDWTPQVGEHVFLEVGILRTRTGYALNAYRHANQPAAV